MAIWVAADQADEIAIRTLLSLKARAAAGRPSSIADKDVLEADWRQWLQRIFGKYVPCEFAPFHEEFWNWVWSVERGQRARPFIAIWPRSFGKSTNAELACAAFAARQTRRYVLYVCSTQQRADDHVQNIAAMLSSAEMTELYPTVAGRMVSKYGHSAGWRRNRLRTSSGFTLDAIGLDVAARGAKIDEDRPDLLIFDDLDEKLDSPDTVAKKADALTRTLIPAGSSDLAVLGVQNLVHGNGIFAQLADARADFLADRIVSGPYPALYDIAVEKAGGKFVLTAGRPSWPAMDLAACQAKVDEMGLTAFLAECQHDVDVGFDGIFSHVDFRHCAPETVPDLLVTVVWVDPAVTDTDNSDSQGICAMGLGTDRQTKYALWAWEGRTSPLDALQRAIKVALDLGARCVGVETDQGGDTWQSVYREAFAKLLELGEIPADSKCPNFQAAKAGAGHGPKTHRASQMLADYEKGRMVHVLGTHATLERALRRFPRQKPFDLVDAGYWCWWDLKRYSGGKLQAGEFRMVSNTTRSRGSFSLMDEIKRQQWDSYGR